MGKKLLSKEQEELFIKEYPNKTNRELEKMFNLSYEDIRNLGRKNRIKKTDECNKRCRVCSEEHRKNLSISHRDYKMPEEQKRKIRLSTLGRIVSEETRKKLSISKMGDKNPMKNPEISIKVSRALTGVKFSDARKEGLRYNIETNPNYGMTGKHHTKESMLKRFNTMKERNSFTRMFGDKNPSKRQEVRENYKEKRKNWVTPVKDTTIELKIQNFLKQLGVDFLTHQHISKITHGYQCDILIPSMNLVIECDGDYWHKYPIGREIDHIRTSELIEKGFKVLRLWEFEIRKMDINKFKERLL